MNTAVEAAKAALRAHVERTVPQGERAELSKLTAAFVAAVVREERGKARRQLELAVRLKREVSNMRELFNGFGRA